MISNEISTLIDVIYMICLLVFLYGIMRVVVLTVQDRRDRKRHEAWLRHRMMSDDTRYEN